MKKKGFTLIELLLASFVTLFTFSGAIYTYTMLQKFWQGGNVQLFLQSRARLAMDKVTRQIRPALEAQLLNSGNTLKLRLDPNGTETILDDIWCRYDFANNQITFKPDISDTDTEVILENAYQSGASSIFAVNGNNIGIIFEVRDPGGLYGHRGTYMKSSATIRNG